MKFGLESERRFAWGEKSSEKRMPVCVCAVWICGHECQWSILFQQKATTVWTCVCECVCVCGVWWFILPYTISHIEHLNNPFTLSLSLLALIAHLQCADFHSCYLMFSFLLGTTNEQHDRFISVILVLLVVLNTFTKICSLLCISCVCECEFVFAHMLSNYLTQFHPDISIWTESLYKINVSVFISACV